MALRPYLARVPLDIVTLLRDRLSGSPGDSADAWAEDSGDRHHDRAINIRIASINTDRGGLVEALADLLRHDEDGAPTAAVSPILHSLA